MRVGDAFPSKYLRPADLGGREREVTITRVVREKIGQDPRIVAQLAEAPKGLVLNRTMATVIAKVYGEETDDWAGRRIVLFVTQVEFGGQSVPAIRVRIPAAAAPVRDTWGAPQAAGGAMQAPAPASVGGGWTEPGARRPEASGSRDPGDDDVPF